MTESNYTSLELSKKLAEAGCELESENMWVKYELWSEPKLWPSDIASETAFACLSGKREYEYRAYDILNDICVKYAKEFFGESVVTSMGVPSEVFEEYLEKRSEEIAEYYSKYGNEKLGEHCKEIEKTTALANSPIRFAYDFFPYQTLLVLKKLGTEAASRHIWRNCLFNPKNK